MSSTSTSGPSTNFAPAESGIQERDIESGTTTPQGSHSRIHPRRGDDSSKAKGGKWYTKIGKGMWRDIVARAPYYASDWTDAWNYRVVPATWVSSGHRVKWEGADFSLSSLLMFSLGSHSL